MLCLLFLSPYSSQFHDVSRSQLFSPAELPSDDPRCIMLFRSLDLLLATVCQCEQNVQTALQAGILPIMLHALKRYCEALQSAFN